MQQITITVDDSGKISVDVQEDGKQAGKPYECSSPEECLKYVQSVLSEESNESPEEAKTEGPEDYAAMWQQESQKRGAQAAAPGAY